MSSTARAQTSHLRSMTIARPGQEVTFEFPNPSDEIPRTNIIIPKGSHWTPSPHWHEQYTEKFRVLAGRVHVVVDGKHQILEPHLLDSAQVVIQPNQVHEFWRADVDAGEEAFDGDVIVQEWTDPADGRKEVFFRNLLSVVEQAPKPLSRATKFQITMISVAYDGWPVLVEGRWRWIAAHVVHNAGYWMARLWYGMSAWYEEYTPSRLHAVAAR